MEPKQFRYRLAALGGLFVLFLLWFIATMFDAQILHGDDYLNQSISTNASVETVEASRGILTDRNGKVLISNRAIYTLEFDASLVPDDSLNDAISRLLTLLDSRGVAHGDLLPISETAPFSYDFTPAQGRKLIKYLTNEKWINPTLITEENFPTALPAPALFARLRSEYGVDSALSDEQARALVGLRYSLAISKMDGYAAFTCASDVDVPLISLIKDGNYEGVKVGTASERVYETDAAAHILGRVGAIQNWDDYKDKGYAMNDLVGLDGAEYAFEEYLRGKNGKRVVSTNAEGKVTSEFYSVEPQPGGTVALTLDIDFQQSVEDILARTVAALTEEDGTARGAAAAVVQVGTGEVLALASYPTYSLKTFNQDYNSLLEDPLTPMLNRATRGTYPPGSTIKPLTAVAALESGVTSTTERIFDTGKWYYPGYAASYTWCSNHAGHGYQNVTAAITNSCNYYFAEMGYRLGMEHLNRYFTAFGLGEHTGIEIGDRAGSLPTQEEGHDLAPWAAYGQANQLYTPLQLANYIATLVDGGTRYNAHLLKDVRKYDSPTLLHVYDEPPAEIISIEPKNLSAIMRGMLDLTTKGSVSRYFTDCVVSAGAKTGTAQTGTSKSNSVFVCFAPYDNPQIALALVVEKGGTGGSLATTAVEIINAYFSSASVSAGTTGENSLLK